MQDSRKDLVSEKKGASKGESCYSVDICLGMHVCIKVRNVCIYMYVALRLRRMGKALAKLFGKKDMRIVMLGLAGSGKTSILIDCAVMYLLLWPCGIKIV